MRRGDPANAWIIYNFSTENLSVFWSYGSSPDSSISYQINLKEILPQWAAVGFLAATGPYVERHILESWEFSSNLDIAKTRGSKAKKIGLVADLTAAGAILIVGGLIVIEALRRNKQSATANLEMAANSTTSTNDDLEKGAGLFWVESQY